MSIFRSAIQGPEGGVDAGYLGLYMVGAVVLGAIPATLALATIRMVIVPDHPLDLVGIAALIGAAGTCFGVAAGGVGLFRAGDKPHTPMVTSSAQVSAPANPAPAPLASDVLEQAGRGYVVTKKGRK